MSETAAEVFAEASRLSMITNPATQSRNPYDTTRSPDRIEEDVVTMDDILARYDAACLAETGKKGEQQVDANPYWNMRYKLFHFEREFRVASKKGNT